MYEKAKEYMPEWTDTFVHQQEWGVGRGGLVSNSLYLLLALFFGGIGAGAAGLSLLIEREHSDWYFVAGFLIGVVGKGLFHLLFLGNPLRFWRALSRPNSSWISRGIIALSLFSITGFLYIVGPIMGGFAESGDAETVLAVINLGLLAMLIVYDGFLLNAASGITAWNVSMMIVLFPLFNVLGGAGVVGALYGVIHTETPLDVELLHQIETGLLIAGAFALTGYLINLYNDPFSRLSEMEATVGRLRYAFWVLVVLGGIVVPLIVAALSLTTDVAVGILAVVALVAVVGDYAFKYTVLSIGEYKPVYTPARMSWSSRGNLASER